MNETVEAPPSRAVAEIRREPMIVHNEAAALLDTAMFEQISRVAHAMAEMSLLPEHLRKKPADCILVVEQAWRWQMSPTAVAAKTFVVGGKLAYEGQLIAAVVNARAGLVGRLAYDYEGTFDRARPADSSLQVTVSGTLRGETAPRTVTVRWADGFGFAQGAKDKWQKQPDQQLAYFAARAWCRRHTPDVLMGVYTPEELVAEAAVDVTPSAPRPRRDAPAPDVVPEPPSFDFVDETGEAHDGLSAAALVDQVAAAQAGALTPAQKLTVLENNREALLQVIAGAMVGDFDQNQLDAWFRDANDLLDAAAAARKRDAAAATTGNGTGDDGGQRDAPADGDVDAGDGDAGGKDGGHGPFDFFDLHGGAVQFTTAARWAKALEDAAALRAAGKVADGQARGCAADNTDTGRRITRTVGDPALTQRIAAAMTELKA